MINERKLESYVEMQFGTNLYEFIKQKVEVDRLYDYEIASLLGVSDSMIRRLRNTYRIKRANGFIRRFDQRYGKGAVDRFKKMVEDPSYTLDEVGRQFGFSKENARQVYQKVFGSPYTEAYKRKRFVKKKKGLVERTKRLRRFGDLVKVGKRMKPTVLGEETILAQIMTTRELAKYLRLHEITILKNAAKGIIPGIRIGNRWRFDKEAIDQWIAAGQTEPLAEKKPKATPISEPEKRQTHKKEKSKRRR